MWLGDQYPVEKRYTKRYIVDMKLTVLGSAPAPAGLGCQSSYVIETEQRILVDCGSGVANALAEKDFLDLDAIVITHQHADHITDLASVGYYYRLVKQTTIPLYTPQRDLLENYLEAVGASGLSGNGFEIRDYVPGEDIVVGQTTIKTCEVPHAPELRTAALRFETEQSIVISSDCKFNQPLIDFAKGASILICEATLRPQDTGAREVHMDYLEAAQTARQAEANMLLLTHTVPAYYTPDEWEKIGKVFPYSHLASGVWTL